jgi:hypothetical protein
MKEKLEQKIKRPSEGDKIYIPTSLYLSHGRDDFWGGICIISKIEKYGNNNFFIKIKENPGASYNYNSLLEQQEELKERYGTSKGEKCPDNSLESNVWASPGDIVDGKEINYYIP